MPSDLRKMLRDAAGAAKPYVGFEVIRRRSRVLRLRRLGLTGLGVVASLVLGYATVDSIWSHATDQGNEPPIARLGQEDSGNPSSHEETSRGDKTTASQDELMLDSASGRLHPESHPDGDSLVMTVTFPDGTTADVAYGPRLDLSLLGVRPFTTGVAAADHSTCGRTLLAFYRYDEPFRSDQAPVATYPGPHGAAKLWRAPEGDPARYYLVLRIGAWVVGIPDSGECKNSDGLRAIWARSLGGYETDNGFLVLKAESPVTLAGLNDKDRPQLIFGSASTEIILTPGGCSLEGHDDVAKMHGRFVDREVKGFASWCLEDGVAVSAYGNEAFIKLAVEELEIRGVRPSK